MGRVKTARQKFDFYETPPHYLEALSQHLVLPARQTIVEPCAGDGAISNYFMAKGHRLITNDIDPKRNTIYHFDATNGLENVTGQPHRPNLWVITNPPFSDIEKMLVSAFEISENVVFLARLSILEPTRSRRSMFQTFGIPQMVIVLPRYQFTKPSKDTMTCCWIGWGNTRVPNLFTIALEQCP